MRTITRSTLPAAAAGATAVLALTTAALAAVVLTPAHAGAAGPPRLGGCGPGELCLWEKGGFKGQRHTYELAGTDIESCVALPEGGSAQAIANRTGRPVTTYQSAECAETGEFNTYPGNGTWAPQSPYKVRAFKIWES
ncbi:peptidase inhibitor family I36 protein [Streptomyces flavofungini]|uniref:peptidase inhibitor family I36 protein n=1 Tax=Streptomyces flavofungini TaxID=68200 RepID=UPI0025B1B3D7|nr:peptidase inhibitor family I36 protein [Streptomyces flavofungini]WJV49031.1 peptidase inhibitor family I36 protein [Streptomyces flavofungini]